MTDFMLGMDTLMSMAWKSGKFHIKVLSWEGKKSWINFVTIAEETSPLCTRSTFIHRCRATKERFKILSRARNLLWNLSFVDVMTEIFAPQRSDESASGQNWYWVSRWLCCQDNLMHPLALPKSLFRDGKSWCHNSTPSVNILAAIVYRKLKMRLHLG